MTDAHPQARGIFITFEGGEGTGKSTQVRLLVERLAAHGIPALATREPGGSPGAERIRGLLLDPDHARFGSMAEALLFYAARADHLETLIRPALAEGRWVVCDRFSDSTRAYQGALGTLPPATVDVLEAVVVGKSGPELTILLDLPADIGLARAAARRGATAGDGFERESLAFHVSLRRAFLDLAAAEPERFVVIDAGGDVATVADAVYAAVRKKLGARVSDRVSA